MTNIAMKMLAVAALALGISAASAQQPALQSYDVELVVFRNLTSSATAEDWAAETGITATDVSDEDSGDGASTPVIPNTPAIVATDTFPALGADKFKLSTIEDTLRRSRGYRPVAHFGWTQPGFPRGEMHYMAIDSLLGPGSGLMGRVSMSRGRYLHLTLDLTLEAEGSDEHYVLRQTRRMRSNEKHYIDHPKFGVIALVTQSAVQ